MGRALGWRVPPNTSATMTTVKESFWVPIDPPDLLAVASMLRAADVFIPTFRTPEVDLYDPAVYLRQIHRFKTKTQLLIDRNVFTRILAIWRGTPPDSAHRLAAAVLAFAQCSGIEVEPNLALYEVASLGGQDTADSELSQFRLADNLHPGYWAEIALRRSDFLEGRPDVVVSDQRTSATNFEMPIRRWRRNYILCLKMAEIELEGGRAEEKLRRFARWSFEEFLLGGPAISLAAHYFAPNARRKGLLKGLQSEDRERALSGIRNAAWDLSILSEWLLYIEQQERDYRLVLLTSFDAWVHRIARTLADTSSDDDRFVSQFRNSLIQTWGANAGSKLASEIEDLYGNREAPHRRINSMSNAFPIEQLIALGEARIREWRPPRPNGP